LQPDPLAVGLFEERFGAVREGGLSGLNALVQSFARLPYENLSKILAWDGGARPPSPRAPRRVMREHVQLGTGGTCFSLTELLRQVVVARGLDCHPVMAHMRHGLEIHCALRVEADGAAYLVDPGYLVPRPMPLLEGAREPWEEGQARLVRAGSLPGVPDNTPDGDFDLYTLELDGPRWRYRFCDRAPTPHHFLERWLDSFRQSAMRSLLVTRRDPEQGRLYLHNHKLRTVGRGGRQTRNIRPTLQGTISSLFGIDGAVVSAAWEALQRAPRTVGPGKGARGGQG